MKRAAYFSIGAGMILLFLWQLFFSSQTNWYVAAVILIFLSIIPFIAEYERKKPTARQLTLTAAMIALAVVSRSVFYLVPQVKPIAAVVIVAAVCLGPMEGYIIGMLSAFLSNFIFGQGIWTPFQMVGLGLVGLIAGLVLKMDKLKSWKLAVCGFFLAMFVYGLIVDTATVLVTVTQFSWKAVLAVYASGVLFDFSFGISTAVFLFIFGMPFASKINRINVKYEIFKN